MVNNMVMMVYLLLKNLHHGFDFKFFKSMTGNLRIYPSF
jgi:hypothetical protein